MCRYGPTFLQIFSEAKVGWGLEVGQEVKQSTQCLHYGIYGQQALACSALRLACASWVSENHRGHICRSKALALSHYVALLPWSNDSHGLSVSISINNLPLDYIRILLGGMSMHYTDVEKIQIVLLKSSPNSNPMTFLKNENALVKKSKSDGASMRCFSERSWPGDLCLFCLCVCVCAHIMPLHMWRSEDRLGSMPLTHHAISLPLYFYTQHIPWWSRLIKMTGKYINQPVVSSALISSLNMLFPHCQETTPGLWGIWVIMIIKRPILLLTHQILLITCCFLPAFSFKCLFICVGCASLCVCECEQMCAIQVVNGPLPHCRFWGSNPCCQVWWQAFLATEPWHSPQFLKFLLS